jgi:predicted DNA-binding protein
MTVRIPDELSQVLQAETERRGRSTGELVRAALTVYLAFLAAVRVSDEHERISGCCWTSYSGRPWRATT